MEWKLWESAGACFLRTLDLVRRYETADGVFIQLRVVGAEGPLTWVGEPEVQGWSGAPELEPKQRRQSFFFFFCEQKQSIKPLT